MNVFIEVSQWNKSWPGRRHRMHRVLSMSMGSSGVVVGENSGGGESVFRPSSSVASVVVNSGADPKFRVASQSSNEE